MFKNLGQIQNPLVRSITAGSASFALVTIIAFVALGFSGKSKDKEANQTGIYASLLGFVVGAGAGLLIKGDKVAKHDSVSTTTAQDDDTWKDWRDFKIIKKQP